MTVFYAALKEKQLEQTAIAAIEAVNYHAGAHQYVRLDCAAQRTDMARNILCRTFRSMAKDPEDTFVMLDYDHAHPIDIIEKLVAHNLPVVGALAFLRGEPYYPCVFFRNEQGVLQHPRTWQRQVYRVDAIGTAAIAIKRRVFDQLEEPYFVYTYPPGDIHPSEDMYFCRQCELAGIPMYCDFGLVTPHLKTGSIDDLTWRTWLSDHPDTLPGKLIDSPNLERMLEWQPPSLLSPVTILSS